MPELTGPVQHVELSSTLWLIPLAPLLGFLVNLVFGRRLQASAFGLRSARRMAVGSLGVTLVALTAMVAALVLTVTQVVDLARLSSESRYLHCHLWQMARIGSVEINFDLALDPLAAVMALVITFVGSLIHVYAAAYMAHDDSYWRFFAYLNLFVFSMLLLVLGDSFVVLFFGWEGVGLCSYLLIGFWYKDYDKASAGMKAFVTNRIGDCGLIVGVLMLFWALGGTWVQGGFYQPENGDRFAVVTRSAPARLASERTGRLGALTLTAYPGATVFLDNASRPFAVSPFVQKPLPAGRHHLRLHTGPGATDAELPAANVTADTESVIAPVGPTFVFRQIHDQLVLSDSRGVRPLREDLGGQRAWGSVSLVTVACLLIFLGAVGKSAQIPLYVWLPDAMAGPTPVSALIHAATMVTAGVYLLARVSWLITMSAGASATVALVGALTALLGASIGFYQYDLKKILAYSTVSQLGFMFVAVGTGAYGAAVFHLVTHAFFKACLFLGSGSVIHAMHAVTHDADGAQDVRNMGGLRKLMPRTARSYFIACAAISSAPVPLLAGFWSKDEILWKALTSENTGPVPGHFIYILSITAALGTAFYMWRSYYLVFEGPHARPELPDVVEESPRVMTAVLTVLAAFSAVAGVVLGASWHWLGVPSESLLEHWLEPVMAHADAHFRVHPRSVEYGFMAASYVLALGGFAIARQRYGGKRQPDWRRRERSAPFFIYLRHAYGIDDLYRTTIVAWVLHVRLVLADMDRWVVDGLVNGVGVASRASAWVTGAVDQHLVDGLVHVVSEGTLRAGRRLRTVQNGRIQSYVYGIVGGVAFLSILRYFLGR